jgi:hypothetical protein
LLLRGHVQQLLDGDGVKTPRPAAHHLYLFLGEAAFADVYPFDDHREAKQGEHDVELAETAKVRAVLVVVLQVLGLRRDTQPVQVEPTKADELIRRKAPVSAL